MMKKKFTKILGVSFAISLLMTTILVSVPVAALSQPSVIVIPNTACAIADYTIFFYLNEELGSNDTITVTFPSNTSIGAINAAIDATPGWIGGVLMDANLTSTNWTYNAAFRTITYTLELGNAIGIGAQVKIDITDGTTNPSTPGSYTLTVHTSQEITPVASGAYIIVPKLAATVDFNPDTLSLKSKGEWVTAYIELPECFNVSSIDVSTVFLNESIMAETTPVMIGDYDNDTIPDLMVKFDKVSAQDLLTPGEEIDICISGEVGGVEFEGHDLIRVIDK